MKISRIINYKQTVTRLTMFLALFTQGCWRHGTGIDTPPGRNGPHVRYPEYGWGFANRGTYQLEGVGIRWDRGDGRKFTAAAGSLPPSLTGGKEDNEGFAPLPETGTVHWNLGRGTPQQTQDLVIASIIPDVKHFSGVIWLVFDGTKWDVVPISKQELQRRMKAGLKSTP